MQQHGTVFWAASANITYQRIRIDNLTFGLKQLCRRHRDGSFSTRATRQRILVEFSKTLRSLGFRPQSPYSLKPKHVDALIQEWERRKLASGTRKVYMSQLRWWAEKIGKTSMIDPSNRKLGLPDRRSNPANKAKELSNAEFALIDNEYVRYSVMLQQAFGLRKEEAIKFRPSYADQGQHIRLKGSWTKGGRPRKIPITHYLQRELLDQVRKFAGTGSLIPFDKKYIHQVYIYENVLKKLDLKNLHGLRHGYAQRRYKQLTGWQCPKAGGPTRKQLTKQQYEVDQNVRLKISQELGHNRIEITKTYCGA